ncbi:hypothetical protein JYY74_004233 [Salmonella enterica subsp. enterica serovar Enteritidis]|nr:hypothetical protein [Salmonella enterica subsp. enterica serovar Enteritidis]
MDYERKIFALTNQLQRLDLSQDSNGGPYNRIKECREIAKVAATLPPEQARELLFRLSFIDAFLNGLIPLTTANMRPERKEMWENMLKEFPVDEIYVQAMNALPALGGHHHDR